MGSLAAGAGSGGTIVVIADSITGTGAIQAVGGPPAVSALLPENDDGPVGTATAAGGGGRIVLRFLSMTLPTATISAAGGAGSGGTAAPQCLNGGAGTVFLHQRPVFHDVDPASAASPAAFTDDAGRVQASLTRGGRRPKAVRESVCETSTLVLNNDGAQAYGLTRVTQEEGGIGRLNALQLQNGAAAAVTNLMLEPLAPTCNTSAVANASHALTVGTNSLLVAFNPASPPMNWFIVNITADMVNVMDTATIVAPRLTLLRVMVRNSLATVPTAGLLTAGGAMVLNVGGAASFGGTCGVSGNTMADVVRVDPESGLMYHSRDEWGGGRLHGVRSGVVGAVLHSRGIWGDLLALEERELQRLGLHTEQRLWGGDAAWRHRLRHGLVRTAQALEAWPDSRPDQAVEDVDGATPVLWVPNAFTVYSASAVVVRASASVTGSVINLYSNGRLTVRSHVE